MSDQGAPADPYVLVIADLEARRAQIDRAIATLKELRGNAHGGGSLTMGAAATATNEPQQGEPSTCVEEGAFLGMTIAEAAKAVMAARKKAQSTSALTGAIRDGGVVLKSQNPQNTVGAVLHRQAKAVGDVVSVGRGMWGLALWYRNPGRFAKRPENDKGDQEPTDAALEAKAIPLPATPLAVPAPQSSSNSLGEPMSAGGDLDDEIPF